MGSGSASGSNRAQEAIVKALDSPLLKDNKITGCKNVLLLIVSGIEEITIDEIGEINDYIQTEAGNHTNIIMGVGEDDALGNEVSVTVIATGFGQEQQNEISNTEAKKIIHTLEDEQKMEHQLTEKDPFESSIKPLAPQRKEEQLDRDPLIDLNAILYDIEVNCEIVPNGIPEKQVHVHSDEEEVPLHFSNSEPQLLYSDEEQKIVEKPVNEESIFDQEQPLHCTPEIEAISTEHSLEPETELEEMNLESSFFEPEFEAVSEVSETQDTLQNQVSDSDIQLEEDFVINEVSSLLSEIDVVDPEEVKQESQIQMDFELPLTNKITEEKVAFQLEDDPVEETTSKISKEFDDASLEVKFELKDESTTLSEENIIGVQEAEIQEEDSKTNPFEQSIDQTIASQSQKRREHLKAFNHKFKHQVQRVDEMEREPAYKRQGMDLEAEEPNTPSRFSLDDDGNDDLQLRSNNSFLHDNVD